jgi:hypothetical protein
MRAYMGWTDRKAAWLEIELEATCEVEEILPAWAFSANLH